MATPSDLINAQLQEEVFLEKATDEEIDKRVNLEGEVILAACRVVRTWREKKWDAQVWEKDQEALRAIVEKYELFVAFVCERQ